MTVSVNRAAVLGPAAVLVYFLALAHGGFGVWFSGDDVVNIAFLHGFGHISLPVLFAEALSVFTPEYRPVGGLYYRCLYAVFGLHSVPFRLIFFILLLVNLGLVAIWFRRLSGSAVTTFAGVTIFSYHAALRSLYYNDGTIYDVLCLLFSLLLLLKYTRVRQDSRSVSASQIFYLGLLLGAALGSKEMAATIPAVLILYELLLGSRNIPLWERVRPILILASMALICMTVKTFVPNQMSINDLYRPHFAPGFIAHNYLRYHQMLFFSPGMTGFQVTAIVALAAAVAIALRSRLMIFGLLFAAVTMFPVSAIPIRGGFVCYVPMVGYGLYIGELVSTLTRYLLRILAFPPAIRRGVPAAVCVVVMCLSYLVQAGHSTNDILLSGQEHDLETLLRAAQGASASLPAGSRVLLENDPFPRVAWETLFVLRLGYRNPGLWVDRSSEPVSPETDGLYSLVLRWTGTGYVADRRDPPKVLPAVFGVSPKTIQRGGAIAVSVPPEFANCPLDVAYRMPDDELIRAGVWSSWMTTDSRGNGTAHIDQDAERGLVAIDHLRACGGRWRPAEGSFSILP